MSFESQLHEHMVRRIVQEVSGRFGHLYSFSICADLIQFGRNKPVRVGGFTPDVYARDVPETCRVIGEAKTPVDFESERSQAQIAAFLRHLSAFPSSHFFLAVPWPYANRARSRIEDLARLTRADAVSVEILGGV